MKSLIFMGYPPLWAPPPPPPPAYTAGGKLIDSKLSVRKAYSSFYFC